MDNPLDDMNQISEKVIEMVVLYFTKYDFVSYQCLLDAAKETSFMYQGKNYPHELVEDIIRKSVSVYQKKIWTVAKVDKWSLLVQQPPYGMTPSM